MYTDEQIAKMTPKVHPAIKMAPKWGFTIPQNEYDKKFEEFTKWVFKEKEFIEKEYGETAAEFFLKFVAPRELKLFLKAGFELNCEYISNIIHNAKTEQYLAFIDKDIASRLMQVRENITTIALTVNALATLNSEFGSNLAALKEKSIEMIKLTNDSLTLLAQGEGQIAFLSKIEEIMREDCKSDKIPTATYMKGIKSLKHTINTYMYNQKIKNSIKNPKESDR